MREGVDEELVRPMKGDNEGERRVGMRKKMKSRPKLPSLKRRKRLKLPSLKKIKVSLAFSSIFQH